MNARKEISSATSVSPLVISERAPLKGLGGIIHLAAWGILFCIPFFFGSRHSESVTVESYLRFIITPLAFMVVFYLNYFRLVQNYLFTGRWGKFIALNILLIATVILVVHLLMQLFPPPPVDNRPERTLQEIIGFYMIQSISYILIAALSVAIRMTNNWYRTEKARMELERSRTEAELQNLKSQLNPHFLFNTLNNIYSLIAFSPERAQEAVHDLSRLLRYVLYDSSQPDVPLGKELDFIRNYVDLMRIRLTNHVDISIHIAPDINPDMPIVPLLFISLIENAFKHGVSPNKESFIRLDIRQHGDQIISVIENTYFPKDGEQDMSGSGIGLVNLQKRLALLYPNKHILSFGRENDKYKTTLIIQASSFTHESKHL